MEPSYRRKKSTYFSTILQQAEGKKASHGAAAGAGPDGGAAACLVACGSHDVRDAGQETGRLPCLLSSTLQGTFRANVLLRVLSRRQPDLQLYARAQCFSESVKGISIHRSILDSAKIVDKELELREVAEEEAELREVVMVLPDRYLSMRDVWHMHLTFMQDGGQIIYSGFDHNMRQHVPRSRIEKLSGGPKGDPHPVICGRVSPRTEVVFRSGCAHMIVLIQVSADLMVYCLTGRPYWEVLLECFAQLIDRTLRAHGSDGDGHYIQLVLFARTSEAFRCSSRKGSCGADTSDSDSAPSFNPSGWSQGGGSYFPDNLPSRLSSVPGSICGIGGSFVTLADGLSEHDIMEEEVWEKARERQAADLYEVFWEGVARALPPTQQLTAYVRQIFMRMQEDLVRGGPGGAAERPHGAWAHIQAQNLVQASAGNVLESLNVVLDQIDQYHMDRPLKMTAHQIILLTAGNGVIHTSSRKLYQITHRRFLNRNRGCEMICMRWPPLHGVPWVHWPKGPLPRGAAPPPQCDETVDLPACPSWLRLSFHKEVDFCPCSPSLEWVQSAFLPLETVANSPASLYVPEWEEGPCDAYNESFVTSVTGFSGDGWRSPSGSGDNLHQKLHKHSCSLQHNSAGLRLTGPEFWEELRTPRIRKYFHLFADLKSKIDYVRSTGTSTLFSPAKFAHTDTETEKVTAMYDLIGCRLELGTCELWFQYHDESFLIPGSTQLSKDQAAEIEDPWRMQAQLLPQVLHHCLVRAQHGRIQWSMKPCENALSVICRDDTGESKGDRSLTHKYRCFVRRNTLLQDAPAGGDNFVDTGWQQCRRIFHLPTRCNWNTIDSIISGGIVGMPAVLPYPAETAASAVVPAQFRNSIKQHLYALVPREEAARSHVDHFAAALRLNGGCLSTGVDPFIEIEKSKEVPEGEAGSSEMRARTLQDFRSFLAAFEELCFGRAKGDGAEGESSSLGIDVIDDGYRFMVNRLNRSLFVRNMNIPTAHPQSRDWLELFYDSQYSPPRPFVFFFQWLVCSSIHLVGFCDKLARLVAENNLLLLRIPCSQLFPPPAPQWVWSAVHETNFDRLTLHCPRILDLPKALDQDSRKKLRTRLLESWLQPPLGFLFLFSAKNVEFKVDVTMDMAMMIREGKYSDDDFAKVQNCKVHQRLKGWTLCHSEGLALIALREEHIYWHINKLSLAEAREPSENAQRLRRIDELWGAFSRVTKEILTAAVAGQSPRMSSSCYSMQENEVGSDVASPAMSPVPTLPARSPPLPEFQELDMGSDLLPPQILSSSLTDEPP